MEIKCTKWSVCKFEMVCKKSEFNFVIRVCMVDEEILNRITAEKCGNLPAAVAQFTSQESLTAMTTQCLLHSKMKSVECLHITFRDCVTFTVLQFMTETKVS